METNAMGKMKTHRGAAKRFKVTGTGKLRRRQQNRNHILEKKPSTRTRRLAAEVPVAKGDLPRIKRLLGR
jgi:large subunit ribosomal protein L35